MDVSKSNALRLVNGRAHSSGSNTDSKKPSPSLRPIPADWVVVDMSDLCTLQRGFDITEATRAPGNVPVFSSSGLAYFHNSPKVSPPGVVTGRKGILGKVFFVEEPFWPHDTTLWVKDFKGNDPRYVALVLRDFGLERLDAATSVPTLNRNNLAGHYVAIPRTRAEQQTIAEVLSDADALIESLEQLLAKKRNIKQGVMQELLTGKRRLPGFERIKGLHHSSIGMVPRDWQVLPFIKIVDSYIDYRGRTPRKLGLAWGHGNILALSANNVQMGRIDPEREANYGSDELYRKWMLKGDCETGDVLLTMEAPLGNVAQIPGNGRYILSQRVLLIKPNSLVSRHFLANSMRGMAFQGQLVSSSTGSTAQGIQRSKLDQLPIAFPKDKQEQDAISSILTDMEAEILALEEKLVKVCYVKQGMMQELLTGRIRLINHQAA